MDAQIADFINFHVNFCVDEAAKYPVGVSSLGAVDALALALHKFVGGITRDVDAADHAEAEFRKRVAVLNEAASASVN